MSQVVGLRPATPDDELILFGVYAGTRAAELASVPWSDAEKTSFLRFQFQAQQQHYMTEFADAEHSVVLLDKEPIGRLWIDKRADEIRILDFAILPQHRGRGVGSRLLSDLMEEAKAKDKPVSIYVEHHQPSASLFERFGFTVVEDNGVSRLMQWRPADEPAEITLRTVDEGDASFLHNLYKSVREPELVVIGWDEQQISDFVTMQYHARESGYKASFPDADQSIIKVGEEEVGQILVSRAGDSITLVDISLLPKSRGQGIGTYLIQDLINETCTTGIPVRLSVAVGNPARRLYERLGFESLNNDGVHEQMEWRPDR